MSDVPVQIVVAVFQTEQGADTILHELEAAKSAGYIGFQNAAVLRRDRENKLHIREKKDWGAGEHAAAGAIVGALIGAIAGREPSLWALPVLSSAVWRPSCGTRGSTTIA